MGTRTWLRRNPLGRLYPRTICPIGSGSVATCRTPCALAAMRSTSKRRRSSFPSSMPDSKASCMSCSLAAAMSSACVSRASAMASSSSFFASVFACSSARWAWAAASAIMHTALKTCASTRPACPLSSWFVIAKTVAHAAGIALISLTRRVNYFQRMTTAGRYGVLGGADEGVHIGERQRRLPMAPGRIPPIRST